MGGRGERLNLGCAIWEDFKKEGEFVPGPERATDWARRGAFQAKEIE